MFGSSFTSQYGESDKDGTWQACLSGFTGEDIARGLRACLQEGGDFPPNAVKFRKLCMKPPRSAATMPIHRADRLLESETYLTQQGETARYWRRMWVVSGMRPLRTLPAEERADCETLLDGIPIIVWGHKKIQRFCNAAENSLIAKTPLPDLRHWCTQEASE